MRSCSESCNKMANRSEKSNTEILPKNGHCTPDGCFINKLIRDNDVLQCRNCQSFVHYACSELPAYQIQACLQYRARRFECAKCITVTPILHEKIKTSKQRVTSNKASNTEGEYRQEIQSVTTRLDTLETKLDKLINKDGVATESNRPTYASIAKDHIEKQEATIKKFMQSERESREEDRWKNSTKCNIIVHNLGENKDEDKQEQREGDKDYVDEVVSLRMGLKVDIVSVERIGARTDEMFRTKRWRPLKVTLKNEEEKNQIMASVYKLGKWDFRVTDDFSKKERETIKEWHQKAKEKTNKEKDQSYVWKVRGSPRTKLYLKKISNKTESEDESL